MNRVYVGIGSNLGKPRGTIAAAVKLIAAEEGIMLVAVSSLRETAPVGYEDQPRFLNGAAVLETELSPRVLPHRLGVRSQLPASGALPSPLPVNESPCGHGSN